MEAAKDTCQLLGNCAQHAWYLQVLRSLALLPEMEIDELATLAQRVASAAAQAEEDEAAFEDAPGGLVCCDVPGVLAA